LTSKTEVIPKYENSRMALVIHTTEVVRHKWTASGAQSGNLQDRSGGSKLVSLSCAFRMAEETAI